MSLGLLICYNLFVFLCDGERPVFQELAMLGPADASHTETGRAPMSRLVSGRRPGAVLQRTSDQHDIKLPGHEGVSNANASARDADTVAASVAAAEDAGIAFAYGVPGLGETVATPVKGNSSVTMVVHSEGLSYNGVGYKQPEQSWWQMLLALGSGTGAVIEDGDMRVNQDLALRMRCQDQAALCLLVVVYFFMLFLSANVAYRQSANGSPVTYYADPRFHSNVMEGTQVEEFLASFNTTPKDAQIQVTGFVPTSEDAVGAVEWRDAHYSVAFTFALDLTPWVVRESAADIHARRRRESSLDLRDGAVEEDVERLVGFLAHDENDLALVEVHKSISWHNWEELAINIKQRIRQLGFHGVVSIVKHDNEIIPVYKNRQWANFMHSNMVKVLCMLSLVGWVFYIPYMWLRCTRIRIRALYRVDISIGEYWPLIADSLSATGFRFGGNVQR